MNKPIPSEKIKPRVAGASPTGLAADYIPRNRADALEYYEWACIHLEGEDQPPMPKDRQRRFSLARVIAHARKAGVDLVVARDGSITLLCSRPAGDNTVSSTNPWDAAI